MAVIKAGTYTMPCAYCQEPSTEPVCKNCRAKIDELTAKEVARSRRGQDVQRMLAAHRNWPRGPEVTC
ncbi:MAG: hypothetical protein AB1652_09745 [Bacillota bacterium]